MRQEKRRAKVMNPPLGELIVAFEMKMMRDRAGRTTWAVLYAIVIIEFSVFGMNFGSPIN